MIEEGKHEAGDDGGKEKNKVEGASKLIGSFVWHGVTAAFLAYLVWVNVMHE